ncbi:hypothetical protein B0H19DRAFT_1370841 [Mycena capillaripes]|nr:hypothetical protein B0H19DRAFT_1370841 [Mycena capillaripes]
MTLPLAPKDPPRMFSPASLILALGITRASVAHPTARAACNPVMTGSAISIGNGGLEIGYAGSVAGASITSQALSTLSPEFIVETATTVNGGFVLKDVNQDNHAPGLFPTYINGTLKLETLVAPEDGTQNWGFVCSVCNDPTTIGGAGGVIASKCNVVSGRTGQCLQIGKAAGVPVTLGSCADLGSFDVYL